MNTPRSNPWLILACLIAAVAFMGMVAFFYVHSLRLSEAEKKLLGDWVMIDEDGGSQGPLHFRCLPNRKIHWIDSETGEDLLGDPIVFWKENAEGFTFNFYFSWRDRLDYPEETSALNGDFPAHFNSVDELQMNDSDGNEVYRFRKIRKLETN